MSRSSCLLGKCSSIDLYLKDNCDIFVRGPSRSLMLLYHQEKNFNSLRDSVSFNQQFPGDICRKVHVKRSFFFFRRLRSRNALSLCLFLFSFKFVWERAGVILLKFVCLKSENETL